MNGRALLERWSALAGLDPAKARYEYGADDRFGWMSKSKIPEKWVKTTCGYCSVGCGIHIGVKDGRAISVKGDPDHLASFGKLCPKGLSEHESISAPGRALYPMLKEKGQFRRAEWREALDRFSREIRVAVERYGPESVGIISTGQLVTEEFYTLGKLARLGMGVKHYDGNTTLCMSTAVAGYKRSFGSDGPPGAYEDLALADCLLLIGANIADNHPILTCWVEANTDPRRTLIVADPRVTKTAMMADLHLALKPRSDVALLNGMMHILVREGLIDRAWIDRHTTGFKDLAGSLESYTPERVAAITGLSEERITGAARAFGRASNAMVAWTMGVNHSDQGTETVNAINNLALLSGRVGRPGSSPFSITGQCNAMGTRETGFTASMPGYRPYEDAAARAELAALWDVDESDLPAERGHAYPDIIEAVISGKIRVLWIIATNPVVSYPNREFLEDALSRLDYLVVQDGFHPTPTSALADLVLPAAIWGEKEGTYTNSERRVSKVNRAVAPPGEAKSDFEIFLEMAKTMGVEEKIFPGWTGSRDAFEEWRKVSKGRLCDYSGITYELLDEVGGVQWPFPDRGLHGEALREEARKTRRLYTDGVFPTLDGRARLIVVEHKTMPEEPNAAYPLLLNTGRTVEHWHTRTKTGGIEILKRLSPEAWIEMNPRDARKLKLRQGDRVRVVSRRGAVDGITLRITEIVAPGQVFIPFHWFEKNANNLTLNVFDPISREPNYKQCAVKVTGARH
jgi:assimilatory nitrate reductase catalytic subunit